MFLRAGLACLASGTTSGGAGAGDRLLCSREQVLKGCGHMPHRDRPALPPGDRRGVRSPTIETPLGKGWAAPYGD